MTTIVIGGGISGLTIVRNLTQHQVPVILLEAQDRLGGRVLTKDGFDLGASWLHDSENNDLFPVAKNMGAKLMFDTKFSFIESGKPVSSEVEETVAKILAAAGEAPKEQSVRDFAIDQTEDIQDKNLRKSILNSVRVLELWAGASWREVAAVFAAHDTSPDAFNLSGNEIFIHWLKSEIDWNYVTLKKNTAVKSISRNSPEMKISPDFLVKTESGEEFEGKYVACTIPLGSLNRPGLFDLKLPAKLERALANASMATLGKVVLTFDQTWWDTTLDRVGVLGTEDPLGPPARTESPGQSPIFFTFAYKDTDQHALVALTAASLTKHIEANPQDAFKFLLPALQQIRRPGINEVPRPSQIQVTDWSQNRFFNGSYSNATAEFLNIVDAFEEGHGNLRFAGEHTTLYGAGCMHGAFRSGERESEHILGKTIS